MRQTYLTGTLAGAGSFRCKDCGYGVALGSRDQVPECPNCSANAFARASLFESSRRSAGLAPAVDDDSKWIEIVRAELDEPGHYLACLDQGRVSVMPLLREWTRVGRSPAADIRLDDPTVSRRHALIVRQSNGVRVLDDRSLNGVFLNGEAIEWGDLADGDELVVGRYRLRFLDTTNAAAATDLEASQALA